jgi:hypothetical protein
MGNATGIYPAMHRTAPTQLKVSTVLRLRNTKGIIQVYMLEDQEQN